MSKFRKILGVSLLVLVLALTAILTTACGSSSSSVMKPEKVKEDSIKFDGEVIEWEGAKYASSYKVVVGDADLGTTTSTKISYKPLSTLTSITIKITPLNKKEAAGKTTEKTFTKLEGGENITIVFDEDGNASWDLVEGATAYEVEVNGKKVTTYEARYPATDFNRGVENKIRVRPTTSAANTYSTWSAKVSATFLAAPNDIEFDGSRITWKGSSQASAYEIYINGNLFKRVEVGNGALAESYDPEGQSFNLSLRSIGNGKNVFSSLVSEEERYIYLAKITELTVDNGQVSWPTVSDAVKYEYKIGDKNMGTLDEPIIKDLKTGVDNLISVKPLGDDKKAHYFSEWSDPQKVHIIAAPLAGWDSTAALDGTAQHAFTWSNVTGVSVYNIKIVKPDGTTEMRDANAVSTSLAYDFRAAGTYEISVKAKPVEGTGYYESAYSKVITVERLAAPSPASTGLITSTDISCDFTVHLKDQSGKGAIGYQLYKESQALETIYSSKDFPVTGAATPSVRKEQQITYSVKAVGTGSLDHTNRVVLSSLTEENLEFKITVLAAPTNLKFAGSILSWDQVLNASSGYRINGISNATPLQNSYDLMSISSMEAGTYPISIIARGDGKNILDSLESEPVTLRKLGAPTDLHYNTTGEQEGKFTFGLIEGADSYELCFNGESTYHNATDAIDMNKYITTNGARVQVRACANSYNEIDKIYNLTSDFSEVITLWKLATPTWADDNSFFNETHVFWNAPTNVNLSKTPNYIVYNGSGAAYTGMQNSNNFSLESFAPGEYTFSVKAIGDGYNTINSDVSEPRTVRKLETPEVSIAADRLSYTWVRVPYAQEYHVKMDGVLVKTVVPAPNQLEFNYTPESELFNKGAATYTISVTAVSLVAMDSEAAEKSLQVKNVSQPKFEAFYKSTAEDGSYSVDGKVMASATATDAANTTGFIYMFDGIPYDQPLSVTEFGITSEATGARTVAVIAKANKFHDTDNNVYYINSKVTETKSVTILSKPGSSGVEFYMDGTLMWKAVENAHLGYELYVVYADGSKSEVYTTNSNTTSFSKFDFKTSSNPNGKFDIEQYPTYTFYIRAKGDGKNLVASEWLKWTSTSG